MEACDVLWWARRFVCLSVCLCTRITRKPHGSMSPNVGACCLWTWLSPRLAALRHVMYFRFCRWRHVLRRVMTEYDKHSSQNSNHILLNDKNQQVLYSSCVAYTWGRGEVCYLRLRPDFFVLTAFTDLLDSETFWITHAKSQSVSALQTRWVRWQTPFKIYYTLNGGGKRGKQATAYQYYIPQRQHISRTFAFKTS